MLEELVHGLKNRVIITNDAFKLVWDSQGMRKSSSVLSTKPCANRVLNMMGSCEIAGENRFAKRAYVADAKLICKCSGAMFILVFPCPLRRNVIETLMAQELTASLEFETTIRPIHRT